MTEFEQEFIELLEKYKIALQYYENNTNTDRTIYVFYDEGKNYNVTVTGL